MLKALLIGTFAISSALLLSACSQPENTTQGYIEGNLTYIASSQAGRLKKLDVTRGQQVKKGQSLFQIERQPRLSQFNSAHFELKQAESNLANLLKGQRPSKLQAIDAQIRAAQAQVAYADIQLKRNISLVKTGSVQEQKLDLTRQNAVVAAEKLKQLQAKLVTANLPARVNQVKAAHAAVEKAQADLNESNWTLSQTLVKSPDNATVFDNLYWPGEEVPANQPVITLLVPAQIKAIFFVPEPMLPKIKLGEKLSFTANGTSQKGHVVISYISPKAEYTPPVIYSNQRSQKLVYRVEARFANAKAATAWHPGQPIVIDFPKA